MLEEYCCCITGRKKYLTDNEDDRLIFSCSSKDYNNHGSKAAYVVTSAKTCAWCSTLLGHNSLPDERIIGFSSYGSRLRLCNDECWRNWLTKSFKEK
jgi:hypothetical protein